MSSSDPRDIALEELEYSGDTDDFERERNAIARAQVWALLAIADAITAGASPDPADPNANKPDTVAQIGLRVPMTGFMPRRRGTLGEVQ